MPSGHGCTNGLGKAISWLWRWPWRWPWLWHGHSSSHEHTYGRAVSRPQWKLAGLRWESSQKGVCSDVSLIWRDPRLVSWMLSSAYWVKVMLIDNILLSIIIIWYLKDFISWLENHKSSLCLSERFSMIFISRLSAKETLGDGVFRWEWYWGKSTMRSMVVCQVVLWVLIRWRLWESGRVRLLLRMNNERVVGDVSSKQTKVFK